MLRIERKLFAFRDYEGLSQEEARILKEERSALAKRIMKSRKDIRGGLTNFEISNGKTESFNMYDPVLKQEVSDTVRRKGGYTINTGNVKRKFLESDRKFKERQIQEAERQLSAQLDRNKQNLRDYAIDKAKFDKSRKDVLTNIDKSKEEALKAKLAKQDKLAKKSIEKHKSQINELRDNNKVRIAARDMGRWIKQHPGKTAAIIGGTAAVAGGTGIALYKHNKNKNK